MKEYQFECKVYTEDTDCAGIVYHANYIKYFERARAEILFAYGYGDVLQFKQKYGFAVHKVDVDYHKPARVGDELLVKTRLIEMRRVALIYEQSVYHKSTELLLCDAVVRVVCVNANIRPIAIPDELFTKLKGEL